MAILEDLVDNFFDKKFCMIKKTGLGLNFLMIMKDGDDQ